jgi:hypothetical protein
LRAVVHAQTQARVRHRRRWRQTLP